MRFRAALAAISAAAVATGLGLYFVLAQPKAPHERAGGGALSMDRQGAPSAQAGFSLATVGLPTTVIVDRAGREVRRRLGPAQWDSRRVVKELPA